MKQVIFICLLSVTLCLSKPAETQAPAAEASGKPLTVDKVENTPLPHNVTEAQTTQKAAETTPANVVTNATQNSNKTEAATLTPPAVSTDGPKSSEKKEEASSQGNDVKKNEMPTAPPKETSSKTPASNETKPENNSTKPEEKKDAKNETTSLPPTKPTEKPASSTIKPKTADDVQTVQARGFDGPSFMGGIILTLGLLAIGFMGFKYYKNQTERNYHTL